MMTKLRSPLWYLILAASLVGCGKEMPETVSATSTNPPTKKTATTTAAPEIMGNAVLPSTPPTQQKPSNRVPK